MDDYRTQQEEALAMASEYLDKLIPAMETVVNEMTGTMLEDTEGFLYQIIDGFNFMIETFNATAEIVNAGDSLTTRAAMDGTVSDLSRELMARDFPKAGVIMRDEVIPFLRKFSDAAKAYVA